jgi:hypothetical protein
MALTSDDVTLGALLPQLTGANQTDLIPICRPGSTTPLFVIPVSLLILAGPVSVIASEAINAGAFLHYDNNAGAGSVRNAIATGLSTCANCFTLDAIPMGSLGSVYFFGMNTAASPSIATPAPMVWLSETTPGGFQTSAPTTAGHIIQALGPAVLGTGVAFTLMPPEGPL